MTWKDNNTLKALRESTGDFDSVIDKILNQDLSKYRNMSGEEVLKALGLTKCLKTTGYYGDVEYLSAHMLNKCDLTWARFTLAAKDAGFIRTAVKSKTGYFQGAYRDTSFHWEGKDKTFYLESNPELMIYWFYCDPRNELLVSCGAYETGYHGPSTVEYDKLIKKLIKIIQDNFG